MIDKKETGNKAGNRGRVRPDDAGERIVNGHVFRGPYASTNPCVVCGAWEDEALNCNCKEDE